MVNLEESVELRLAKWSDRFIAWLVDLVIVTIVVEAFMHALTIPPWLDGAPDRWYRNVEPTHYLIRSAAFFGYWTYFESTRGQSIGKMVMNFRTVDLSGSIADTREVAISSFGKAFLLPIDLILGWLFTNEKRQRLFNRASKTIVIKVRSEEIPSDKVSYTTE